MSQWVEEPLLFDLSGDSALQELDLPGLPANMHRTSRVPLTDIPEPRVIRHYYRLSTWNMAIDKGLYPLGSCTMKYNPRLNEEVARLPGLANLHPLQSEDEIQGALQVIWETERWLKLVTGFPGMSLHPAAGAHGEFTGMKMIAAWHERKRTGRKKVLVPASSHGTNPKSAQMAGFDVVNLPADANGYVRFETIEPYLDEHVAAVMMTNPNTVGVFEKDMTRIADWLHSNDGLLYFDGANMNAIMGRARAADLGADVLQFNLHKTFSTPHGGGGPGCGPIGVSATLEPFLPTPRVVRTEQGGEVHFSLHSDFADSIGPVKGFYGHFLVAVRALAYVLRLGGQGLADVTDRAVLNANYMRHRLKDHLSLAVQDDMLHEAVFSDKAFAAIDSTTMDFAKALLDDGFHPPTVYFPLMVSGAMMIEPTETEEKEEMDRFTNSFKDLIEQATAGADLHDSPQTTWRRRLDEVAAARNPRLVWRPAEDSGK